jgi:hypothetical protein
MVVRATERKNMLLSSSVDMNANDNPEGFTRSVSSHSQDNQKDIRVNIYSGGFYCTFQLSVRLTLLLEIECQHPRVRARSATSI